MQIQKIKNDFKCSKNVMDENLFERILQYLLRAACTFSINKPLGSSTLLLSCHVVLFDFSAPSVLICEGIVNFI